MRKMENDEGKIASSSPHLETDTQCGFDSAGEALDV